MLCAQVGVASAEGAAVSPSADSGSVAESTPPAKLTAKRIIRNICRRITISSGVSTPTYQIFKEEVGKFVGVSTNSPEIGRQVETFWNTHHNHFICNMAEITPEGRKQLHITKMALEYDLFTDYFKNFFTIRNSPYQYNVNSVQIVNGKKETVIDYIDSILNAPQDIQKYYNIKQIKMFRKLLVRKYGAKRASELTD